MRFESDRLYIRKLTLDDCDELLHLRLRNRKFLRPFEPVIPDLQYTREGQEIILRTVEENWKNDKAYTFGICTKADELIGRLTLSNVVRGAWENCTIGYHVDQAHNGYGYATGAVRLAVQFAFTTAKLHRVQAAVMPRNLPSIRVVEKVGFRYDGFAEYYLRINGVWEGHNLYSITAEHWQS